MADLISRPALHNDPGPPLRSVWPQVRLILAPDPGHGRARSLSTKLFCNQYDMFVAMMYNVCMLGKSIQTCPGSKNSYTFRGIIIINFTHLTLINITLYIWVGICRTFVLQHFSILQFKNIYIKLLHKKEKSSSILSITMICKLIIHLLLLMKNVLQEDQHQNVIVCTQITLAMIYIISWMAFFSFMLAVCSIGKGFWAIGFYDLIAVLIVALRVHILCLVCSKIFDHVNFSFTFLVKEQSTCIRMNMTFPRVYTQNIKMKLRMVIIGCIIKTMCILTVWVIFCICAANFTEEEIIFLFLIHSRFFS